MCLNYYFCYRIQNLSVQAYLGLCKLLILKQVLLIRENYMTEISLQWSMNNKWCVILHGLLPGPFLLTFRLC